MAKIRIPVGDKGKKIPEKEKEKIFGRVYRKSRSSGSSLWLYMIRQVAKRYNGDIRVNDSDLGGVRFDVILRKKKAEGYT